MFGHSFPAGVITVTVIEARDLKDDHIFRKNKPFVELWIDSDYKQRTTELEDTNNPVWDQQFTFNVPEDNSFHDLYLEVLDKEFIGSDDIGKASIDFRSVYEGDVIDEWVSLPAWLGLASRGEVHIRIEFTPKEEEEAAEAEEE